jgi:hypothetical protein
MQNLKALMYLIAISLIVIIPLGAVVYWKHSVWSECRQSGHGLIYCWHIL